MFFPKILEIAKNKTLGLISRSCFSSKVLNLKVSQTISKCFYLVFLISFFIKRIVDACFKGNLFSSSFLKEPTFPRLIVRGALKKFSAFKSLDKFRLLTPAIRLPLTLE